MKISVTQFEHAVTALVAVLRFDFPADAILSRYFREHRQIGPAERTFVAEAVFGVLRKKRLLDHLTAGSGKARALLLAWLTRAQGLNTRELEPLLRRGDADVVAAIKGVTTDALTLAEQAELPDWVVDKLRAQYSDADILQLGVGLAEPAPLDLRVNTLRAKRDTVLTALAADEIAATPTPYSPYGVRLQGRPSINRHASCVMVWRSATSQSRRGRASDSSVVGGAIGGATSKVNKASTEPPAAKKSSSPCFEPLAADGK